MPDRFGNGARRVNDAINWLNEHGYLAVERIPGREPKITLLSELGTRQRYIVPGRADKALTENVYVKLPVSFWAKGWAMDLSAAATAMLLVLLVLERSSRGVMAQRLLQEDAPGVWVSPDQAIHRFDLSEDTRSRGFRELERQGLVMTR